MRKNKKNFAFVLALLIALSPMLSAGVFAKQEKNETGSNRSESKKAEAANIQGGARKGQTKAAATVIETSIRTKENSRKLKETFKQETAIVSAEIDEAAEDQAASEDVIVETVEAVDKRGKIKTFLVGSDYKNLGQLRSELVKNRNQIRKLTRLIATVQDPEPKAGLDAQLDSLMTERQGIIGFVQEKESSFSLFGWLAKLFTGYSPEPIDEAEESDLQEEAERALDKEVEEDVLDEIISEDQEDDSGIIVETQEDMISEE